MTKSWNEEREREWPIESLSRWAAEVVERVERSGGSGEAAYSWMYELADMLGNWVPLSTHLPGQVWSEADLRAVRRRFAHLLPPMRASSDLVPEHPVWITLQLVDLLDMNDCLPKLSTGEVARRIRYLKLLAINERLLRTQFDLDLAAVEDHDGLDLRRPETADEGVRELMNRDDVRARTLGELADDLGEELARVDLPERAVGDLTEVALRIRAGKIDEAWAALTRVVDILYEEMDFLGDFRTALVD